MYSQNQLKQTKSLNSAEYQQDSVQRQAVCKGRGIQISSSILWMCVAVHRRDYCDYMSKKHPINASTQGFQSECCIVTMIVTSSVSALNIVSNKYLQYLHCNHVAPNCYFTQQHLFKYHHSIQEYHTPYKNTVKATF